MTDKKKKPSTKPSAAKASKSIPHKPTSKGLIEAAAIQELAALLKDTDLTEIEYEKNGLRLRVARGGAPVSFVHPAASVAHHAPAAAPAAAPVADLDKHPGTVRSPMVGTAYFSPKPGAEPFIREGSSVTEGQTIMIIEAMKVMNPIKAIRSGKVTKIFVQDAHPVEFDEPLVIIE